MGNTRKTGKEQFYTPKTIANQIVEQALDFVQNKDLFIEPAGGNGSFIDAALESGFKKVISFDIEPHHHLIQKGNFLEQDLQVQNAITISNPPFGRNNSLSIPFFNHSAKFSDLIVFIVPRSWRKWSVQNRLNLNFHLVKDFDLQVNYNDLDNNPLSNKSILKTCVQFWQRKSVARNKVNVKDYGFISKTTPESADVALTVFGFNCGKVETDFKRELNSTKIYLKLNHHRALDVLQSVDFTRFSKNTAYIEALSWQEINYLLNEKISA